MSLSEQRKRGEPDDPALTPTVDGTGRQPTGHGFEVQRGDSIGRFVVIERIGAGGMGVVYAAYDPDLDRKLAVKLLRDDQQDPVRRERLHREAQAMARLSHPNVCVVHDVGTWQGQVYIAMEFIEGQTLGTWVAVHDPDWREVVECFIEAGRGLAAAHEAGLIHRDFKPENVIVGRGRVCVMDFGLARQSMVDAGPEAPELEKPPSHAPLQVLAQSMTSGDRLSSPLTREGAVTGTPAYMSPEQHFGASVDASADQFSFCVSLYEALYRERPFAGDSILAIATAIVDQNIQPAPRNSSVPASLREVVVRGLRSQTDERWSSMDALLEALRAEIEPKRSNRGALMAVGGLSVVAFAIGIAVSDDDDPCSKVALGLQEVWSPTRAEEAKVAFRETGLSYADDAWTRAEHKLERYAEGWSAMRRDACEAANVRHEQSPAMMDLRMTCLDRRLSELDTVVEVLGGGDPDVVEHADDVLRGLGSLARCADADALQSSVPPPVDPDTRAALEGVRAALDRATILGSAGRFDDALDLAQRTAAGVDALGYRPITAEVEVVLGGAFENAADYDAAEEHLERALLAALASGHDEIAVEAAANLVRVVGSRLSRHEEGLRWSRQARSLAERVGGGPDHEINLLTSVASVHDDAARYHKASALRTKAIELIRSQGELDVLQLARTEAALAGTYQSMGRFDEAREILERALGEAEAILGPDHPQLRTFLNPLGIVLDDQGRYDEAIAVYERARKICESSLPAGHPGGATVLTNLGVTLLHVGRSEEALRVQEQALRMLEGALGAETPRVAAALNNVASIHIERRELELAREYIERAVEIWTKVYGPDHPRVAEGLVNLGGVSYGLRDNDAARRHLQRAIEIDEASLGPKHPALLKPLTQLALLDQREDRIAPFLMDTSRMIPLTLHAEPQDAAYAYYRHADALWENGRNAEAYMFALAARTIWASGGDRYRAQVEDVDKWMSNDWDKLPAAPRKSPQPG